MIINNVTILEIEPGKRESLPQRFPMPSKPLLPGSESEPTSSWLASAIKHQWVVWTSAPILLGLVLGLTIPSASTLPAPLDSVSHVIGWTYFTAWSISFYPQSTLYKNSCGVERYVCKMTRALGCVATKNLPTIPTVLPVWLNYSRKSVSGLSLDFQLLNLLGFASYAIYNSFLYWSPLIRLQYQRAHDGYLPAVHMNDVFFAIHAAVLTAVTLLQSLVYPQDRHPPHRLTLASVGAALLGMVGYAAFLALAPHIDPSCTNECSPDAWFTWLNLLYAFSMVKLVVSLVKYVPQVRICCAGAFWLASPFVASETIKVIIICHCRLS